MIRFLCLTCLYLLVLAAVMLVAFAICGRVDAWLPPAVFVVFRLGLLLREGKRPVMKDADWWRKVAEYQPAEDAMRVISLQRASYRPPRHWRLLLADGLGLLGLMVAVPIFILMSHEEFFTFRQPVTRPYLILYAFLAGIYGLPLVPLFRRSPAFAFIVWLVPFLAYSKGLEDLVRKKHPYWHPGVPGWRRLRAEKVLWLKNKQLAAQHADWIVSYASSLADGGNKQAATYLCQQALELDPKLDSARRLMEKLCASS